MAYRMSVTLPEWSRDFLEGYRAKNGLRSINAAIVRLVENELDKEIDAEHLAAAQHLMSTIRQATGEKE